MTRHRRRASGWTVVIVAAATALGVGLGLWQRRRAADRVSSTGLSSVSQADRILQIASATTQITASVARTKAKEVYSRVVRDEVFEQQPHLQTVEQVVDTLGDMKGAMMKLGQMASFMGQDLPPMTRDLLARLQHDAPPMAPALAARVVEEDLGRPPGKLFAEWDPAPFAAASIGQVHRAMTHDGRAVAVKVQYPGVERAIRADLASAPVLFGSMRPMFPGIELKPLLEEIRIRVLEELDYRHEADNQDLFSTHYAGHPHIHIPAVDRTLSGQRVLTTELVDGARMAVVSDWPQHERDLAGETIFRFVQSSLHHLRAFNGDPHPGNYLFHGGGRVTFLDFGMVKRYSDREFSIYDQMMRAQVVDTDLAAYRDLAYAAGYLPRDAEIADDVVDAFFGHFYDFLREDRPVTITPEFARESIRRYFDPAGPFGDVIRVANVPPELAILQRINLGIHSVLALLGATANWHRVASEVWANGPNPGATELGQAEARWRSERAASGTGPARTRASS